MSWILVREIMAMAFYSLRCHKLRSFLTLSGILIGVMAVVSMTGMLRGLDMSIRSKLLALDANVFFVARFGGRMVTSARERIRLQGRKLITRKDARALRRSCPAVAHVAVQVDRGHRGIVLKKLQYEGRKTQSMIIAGVSANYNRVYALPIEEGRLFTEAEERARQRVIVLGYGPASVLFAGISALGKRVRMSGESWTVVGVCRKRKEIMEGGSSGMNDFLLVPARTYEQRFITGEASYQLGVLPQEGVTQETAREQVIQVMRRRRGLKVHQENDFDIISQGSLLELWKSLTQAIFLGLTAISSVALLVGGIGVMAVMLVTVTERTSEIGVRMAVGARRRDILVQFLTEAAILTSLGGLLGVISGVLVGKLMAWGTGLPVSFPTWSYAAGIGVSCTIGIVFGVYPAQRASRLDPIEALRYKR